MRPIIFLAVLFFAGSSGFAQNKGVVNPNADVAYVRNECRRLLLSDTAYATEQSFRLTDDVKYDRDAAGYLKSLAAEGNWTDLNYHSPAPSAWPPSWHLYRLMLLGRAWHKTKDARYLDAVHKGLSFWIVNDFQCPNWWQNQINIPYAYSCIILMLGSDAAPAELNYLDNQLTGRAQQKNPTGQNKIWQHDIEARIALIHQDRAAFNKAILNMESVIEVSTKEGIQPDDSFHQHGAMLQFGNYGLHFVNSLLFWMKVTANTPFAFEQARQQIIYRYCANGLRWTVFNGAMDITATGRQIRPNFSVKRGDCINDDFNLLKSFDNADACKYFLSGFGDPRACSISGNKSFWRSDYMVQQGGGMFSVKMHGPFVKKVESINGENLKGAFLNDGVSLIQRTGKEYQDIEALWNWTMLPGTTCDTTISSSAASTFATNNVSDFVGQVSNGALGISAMYYNRLGVKAYKSYFLMYGMMVALGADIQAPDMANVVTTVNQRNYNSTLGGPQEGKNWLDYDAVSCFSLDPGTLIKSKKEHRKADWGEVDKASAGTMAEGDVLTWYIIHNQSRQYSYLVHSSRISPLQKVMLKHPTVKVLSNTKTLQAIQLTNTVMAVFYQPGILKVGGSEIKADKPCLIIIENNKSAPAMWVSDPSRKLENIGITIDHQLKKIKLPTGELAGSSVSAM